MKAAKQHDLPEFTVALDVAVKLEGKVFLAVCPLLHIVSQGDSAEGALAQFKRETAFLFSTCADDGSLVAVLEKRLAMKRESINGPAVIDVRRTNVKFPAVVPMELPARIRDAASSTA